MQRVLLVEDDEVDAMFLKRLFRKTDKYFLDHTENGKEALEFLKKSWDGQEDLVILTDINMPIMGGIDLLRNLRKDERTANLPVFVFTTSDDDKNIEEAYNYGISGYLLKPLTLIEFEEALEEID